MGTAERLAGVLESEGLSELAELARQHFYDEYLSPLDYPLMRLANDLRRAGRDDLADRAEPPDGSISEWQPTPEDAAEFLKSPRGRDLVRLYKSGVVNMDAKRRRSRPRSTSTRPTEATQA